MNTLYLEKLEYNKILEKLSSYCKTYIGKQYSQELLPSNNKDEVLNMLNETNEATSVFYKASNPPISEIADISVYLKTLDSAGVLSLKAILDLTQILNISNDLKLYFSQDFIDKKDYPILSNLFDKLYTNRDLTNNIFKIVVDENTLSDDASSNLKNIRRKIKNQEQSLKGALYELLHKNSKYIQENIITITITPNSYNKNRLNTILRPLKEQKSIYEDGDYNYICNITENK